MSSCALGRAVEGESPFAVRRRRRTLAPAAIETPSTSNTAKDQTIDELCRIAQAVRQKKPGRLGHPGFFYCTNEPWSA